MNVDIEKLEELAKASAGEWYEIGELRYEDRKSGDLHGLHHDDERFIAAANPYALLAMISDIKGLRRLVAKKDETYAGLERLSRVVSNYNDEVSGENNALRVELDQLKAENENLKSTLATERLSGFTAAFYQVADAVGVKGARSETPEQVFNAEVMPAIDALRKDAERYRWLRDEASPADVEFFSHQSSHGFETEVDAAMSKEAACTHSAN